MEVLSKNYKKILKEITEMSSVFNNNSKYIRALKNNLAGILKEEVYSKMKTAAGREDKTNMSFNGNYLQKIVNKKAQLYTAIVARDFKTSPVSDIEIAKYYAKNIHLDKVLQKGCQFYCATKSALLELIYDANYNLKLIPHANDSYYLWTSSEVDPTTAEVVVKFMGEKELPYTYGNSIRYRKTVYFHMWSKDEFMEVDIKGNVTRKEANPLGFLPFIHVNSESDELFPNPDMDTLSSLLQINSILTDANVANYYQAFPIITAIGVDPESSDLQRNPNSIWILNPKANQTATPAVNVVQSNLQTDKSVALAKAQLELIMDSCGLKVNSGQASANITGIQELINAADITEIRKMMVNDWAYAEEQLWSVIAQYHNWLIKNKIALLPPKAPRLEFSSDFEISVDFPLVDTTAQIMKDAKTPAQDPTPIDNQGNNSSNK